METAVRASMKGKPEAEVWPAVRLAVRDAAFLYYLVSNLTFRALEHKRANWLHSRSLPRCWKWRWRGSRRGVGRRDRPRRHHRGLRN